MRKDDEEATAGEEAGCREESSWLATSDKAKAYEGKRGPYAHRHIYSRLYHGPDWRRQLPGADLRNLRLYPAIGPLPANRGHGREGPREAIAIIHDAIPIIDL